VKFDINTIIAEVQEHYKKDKKAQDMVVSGNALKKVYTERDGIPLHESSIIANMLEIPCVPYNKIIQLAGDSDVGKSTEASQVMASAQKSDHLVICEDTEDKFDSNRYDTRFGGDSKSTVLIKTNEILQGGEKIRKTVIATKTKYPDTKILIVIDSVGGGQSRAHAELELDSEKHAQPGQDAKENSRLMKMLVALINKYPDSIAILLVNQVYTKMGFMQHGDQENGGKKVYFHSSAIIRLKRIKVLTKVIKGRKKKYGIITKAVVTKNHLSQTDMSIHELDFEITANGVGISAEQSDSD